MDIYTKDAINNKLTKKQDTLVSGTNIKTINGNSLLGSGNVTISGSGGSGASVSSADYASANTQLNGLSIDGTNYKLLDVKVNDGKSLIIGNNRSLASGASNAIAIGDCSSSTASGIYSTALGNNSNASGNSSTALGKSSGASGINSTAIGSRSAASGLGSIALGTDSRAAGSDLIAIGYNSTASGENSTAIGSYSEVYVPSWVSFDGGYIRTVSLQSTDNIFFRNEIVDNTKTTQASYTNGKTLTQILNERQGDKLVRIHIRDIIDEAEGINDNSLVFVGFYDLINSALETLGLNLETLSSNWQALMAGEYATQIWSGLGSLLSMGYCFGCFYMVGNDSRTVSPIIGYNYLGYIYMDALGTTEHVGGHSVFYTDADMKTAFANSSMVLDD